MPDDAGLWCPKYQLLSGGREDCEITSFPSGGRVNGFIMALQNVKVRVNDTRLIMRSKNHFVNLFTDFFNFGIIKKLI